MDDSPLEAYRKSDKDASWGYSKTKGWFYGYRIHAAVDAISGLPLAVIVTTGREVGMNYLPALLRKVKENGIRFRFLIADAGYDCEANYVAIVREFKAIPVIKRNERNTKDGATAKQDSLRNTYKGLSYGSKIWEKVYDLRGAVERLFSLAKDALKLEQHTQQGLRSITLLVLIVLLAILLFALTALKLGLPELMLKMGTFVYR